MDTQDYLGKWALILGGSSGLGLATAHRLAAAGMHLCIVHRTRRSALQAFDDAIVQMKDKGAQVVTYNLDATNAEKRNAVLDGFIQKVGKHQLKVLVHSIARGNLKPLFDTKEPVLSNTDFHITLEAMAVSLYDWVSAFAKAELFTDDARIVAFTSEGSSRAWKYYGAVAAAKASLEAIIRGIALEFATIGIKANCIQAGVTDTESLRLIPGSALLKEKSLERNPYKCLTKASDVANVVYLLCRDEASWINGANIPVDGGEHLI